MRTAFLSLALALCAGSLIAAGLCGCGKGGGADAGYSAEKAAATAADAPKGLKAKETGGTSATVNTGGKK